MNNEEIKVKKEEFSKKLEKQSPEIKDFIIRLAKIQSVSTKPGFDNELEKSAEFVRDELMKVGIENAKIVRSKKPNGEMGNPAIVGRKVVDPNLPTITLYAHHDVVDIGDLSKWSIKDPFDPVVKGDKIIGRGVADDGAGIISHIFSLKLFEGKFPCNIAVVIEGEEETGSLSFKNIIEENKEMVKGDVFIVADSGKMTPKTPTISSSSRGVGIANIEVKIGDKALHSGMFGGPILDANILLARLVAKMHNDKGELVIPGFTHGDSEKFPDIDIEEDFRKVTGLIDSYKLSDKPNIMSRIGIYPSISVIGIDCLSTNDAINIISPRAKMRVSFRLNPLQAGAEAGPLLEKFVKDNEEFGAEYKVEVIDSGTGHTADLTTENAKRFLEGYQAAYENDLFDFPLGGGLPLSNEYKTVFPESTVIATGVEDYVSEAHGENENISFSEVIDNILSQTLGIYTFAKK
jgi:acetylornithine deacetylase/succinyl-diaminopimelate desuccinylase-like protein